MKYTGVGQRKGLLLGSKWRRGEENLRERGEDRLEREERMLMCKERGGRRRERDSR